MARTRNKCGTAGMEKTARSNDDDDDDDDDDEAPCQVRILELWTKNGMDFDWELVQTGHDQWDGDLTSA
jgi:hypothetical protein